MTVNIDELADAKENLRWADENIGKLTLHFEPSLTPSHIADFPRRIRRSARFARRLYLTHPLAV